MGDRSAAWIVDFMYPTATLEDATEFVALLQKNGWIVPNRPTRGISSITNEDDGRRMNGDLWEHFLDTFIAAQ